MGGDVNDFPSTVIDEDGNVHHLKKEPLGRGGQGAVFRTRSPHIAVKLIATHVAPLPPLGGDSPVRASERLWDSLTQVEGLGFGPDVARASLLRERIRDVRALPLPDLHLAQPLSILQGHVGYTMRLLNGMVPIRTLIAKRGTASLADFYRDSGGVRRRIEILASTAAILARLHAVPLVYADISPNNIFISDDRDAREVWLIDLDNLAFLSGNGPAVFTAGYGAHEVVTGRAGATTLSDAYSFAVLAFHVLCQTHPFLGAFVEEGGWDDEEDREQMAFAGELPWIEDPDDDCNRSNQGIPRDLVLTPPLREMFQRAFGPGRKACAGRPGMAEWTEVLLQAADRIVSCKACGSSFDVTAGTCRFCAEVRAPKFIHLQVNRWDPDIDPQGLDGVAPYPVWHKMLDLSAEAEVRRHVTEPILADSDDPPVLRVQQTPGGIAVEPLSGADFHYVTGSRLEPLLKKTRFPRPTKGNEIVLHFGPKDRPHRIGVLRYYGGAE